MKQHAAVFLSLTMSAALGLSSCAAAGEGAGVEAPTGAAASTPASTPASASTGGSGSTSASAAPDPGQPAPAVTSTVPATAGAKATPAPSPSADDVLANFTFPDGHLGFSYPADWSVGVVAEPGGGLRAVISDAGGNVLASVTSGTAASDATGPVVRTILDVAPLPGLRDAAGGQLSFGFAFDSFADHVGFHMGVRRAADFDPAAESAGFAHVELPNGDAVARVIFADPAFGSVDAAKAWMATEQYGQLKRMLLSLSYT